MTKASTLWLILAVALTPAMSGVGCAHSAGSPAAPPPAAAPSSSPTAQAPAPESPPSQAAPTQRPIASEFPAKRLSVGAHQTHGYGLLETFRGADGKLHVVAEVWAIQETGPHITGQIQGDTLRIGQYAMCGTVTSRTWRRLRFEKVLSAEEEAQLTRIVLRASPPLVIER